MDITCGIDLGTTNSAIAVNNGKSTQVLTLPNGKKTVPSCVMYKDGKVIVGAEAYKQRYKTNQVVYSCKRSMGTDRVYTIKDGVSEFAVTPSEVSAEILKYLKKVVEDRYEQPVEDIVITVPAYFNDTQKRDTLVAGQMAGFNQIQLLQEPTSAALAYSLQTEEDESILVYDLGGGTFDLSLLKIVNNRSVDFAMLGISASGGDQTIQIVDTAGDNLLGGDDFDLEIYKALCRQMNKIAREELGASSKFSFAKSISKEAREKLILHIESLKKMFANDARYASIPIKMKVGGLQFNHFFKVDPDVYMKALKPIYDRTIELMQGLLKANRVHPTKIVLVGGSTKFPLLREMLENDFPDITVYSHLNPDESVAMGAAILASRQTGFSKIKLYDVVPSTIGICVDKHDLGVVTADSFFPVIKKGTTIPCRNTVSISTEFPDQTEASLKVFEGSSILATENAFIGELYISDIEPKSTKTSIVFQLHVDLSGLVSAKATYDGKTKEVKLINVVRGSDRTKERECVDDSDVVSKLSPAQEKRLSRWIKTVESAGLGGDGFNAMVSKYRETGEKPTELDDIVKQAQDRVLSDKNSAMDKFIESHQDDGQDALSLEDGPEVDVTQMFAGI